MYNIFNFLRTYSLWIAISASIGPVVLSQIYALPLMWWQIVAIGLATFAIYSMDKVSGSKEDLLNTPERAWLARYPIKQIALATYLAAIIIVAASDIWRLPAILSFGFAGYIYTKKVRGHRIKDLPGAKNIIVALATSLCYCGLVDAPCASYLLIFLLIFVGTAIFDLRDIVGDSANGVRTLPVILGRARTLAILVIIDIAILILSPIVGIVALIETFYFRNERQNWQYDLFCDGWFIWMFIAIETLKYLPKCS